MITRRRRRRPLLVAAVVLVVAALAAVLALPGIDRRARAAATALVAEQAQRELGLPAPPTVVIGGGSFLWQAVRGRYDSATVSAPALTYQGTTLGGPLVRLSGIRVPHSVLLGRGGAVTVRSGSARALLPWALLEARAAASTGRAVALGAEGSDVRASTTVTVLRRDLDLVLTATPEVDGTRLLLRPQLVSLAGRVVAVDDVRSLLDRAALAPLLDGVVVGLDDVPPGVVVRDVAVVPDGVVAQADLRSLSFPVPAR